MRNSSAATRSGRCPCPLPCWNPNRRNRWWRTVGKALYTPLGLRTLDPNDPDFHPTYGGPQEERDLAYHQGTVWPFPLGAYYLAYLKVHSHSAEAARQVKNQMEALLPALREGCAGQLPEIYDGETPTVSRGCFAQAWSVGELLRAAEPAGTKRYLHLRGDNDDGTGIAENSQREIQ